LAGSHRECESGDGTGEEALLCFHVFVHLWLLGSEGKETSFRGGSRTGAGSVRDNVTRPFAFFKRFSFGNVVFFRRKDI
ncbi:MAG: hypothetical protein IKO02_08050, partial [Lentisphaeria bacterium]|nr:hypothetical protein [Lentisphaeria bacterium]